MKEVKIYTDGSCRKNPGPGGWGAILVYGDREKEICGGEANTTNNRMELTAAIRALEMLKEPCKVELTSDSRYLVDAMNKGWARSWQEKKWHKPDKSEALNPDLWEMLLSLCSIHDVTLVWTRGHDGHEYNERCDAMAQGESAKFGGDR